MIKKVKISNLSMTFVLRHRWEKDKGLTNYMVWDMRKRFKLGIWCERQKAVGPVRKGKNRNETVGNTFNDNNLVNQYMIGLNLIVCKTWITIQFKPTLTLKIK
jgi:hypothetical protein